MQCTVHVHESLVADRRQYLAEYANRGSTLDQWELFDGSFHELKRLLARTGGMPERASLLRDDVYEFEYIRGSVWVQYSRRRRGRNQVLLTILGWKRHSVSTP